MDYNGKISPLDDVMTVADFKESARSGFFIDHDGYGYPVKDGKYAYYPIYPSIAHLIPEDATHILWLNK